MKILLITPTVLMGGTERYLLNFVKVFRNEHEIELAYYKSEDNKVVNQFEEMGCRIRKFPYYVKHPFKFISVLMKIYKTEQYDLVYIHGNHAASVFYSFPAWRKTNKTKVMYHSHNTGGGNALLQLICRKILNLVCFKQFACSLDASYFMYGHGNAYIINNVIDIEEYAPNKSLREKTRVELGLHDEVLVGNIGRFSKQKNHLFLICIFKAFLDIYPNAKLLLIGDGEEKDLVMDRIRELAIMDKVIVLGTTENAKDYYQCMDLFLLPSLYEGFPFVGVEAQASGTPCLFSDTVPENIRITPIVFFKSLNADPTEWAKEMIDIINRYSIKHDYSDLIDSAGYGLDHMRLDYFNAKAGLTSNE